MKYLKILSLLLCHKARDTIPKFEIKHVSKIITPVIVASFGFPVKTMVATMIGSESKIFDLFTSTLNLLMNSMNP